MSDVTTRYLEFSMETHEIEGQQTVVHLAAETTDRAGDGQLFANDISEAFNPMPDPISGFAFNFRIIVPEDFDGGEPVFEQFLAYGLDPRKIAAACKARQLR